MPHGWQAIGTGNGRSTSKGVHVPSPEPHFSGVPSRDDLFFSNLSLAAQTLSAISPLPTIRIPVINTAQQDAYFIEIVPRLECTRYNDLQAWLKHGNSFQIPHNGFMSWTSLRVESLRLPCGSHGNGRLTIRERSLCRAHTLHTFVLNTLSVIFRADGLTRINQFRLWRITKPRSTLMHIEADLQHAD